MQADTEKTENSNLEEGNADKKWLGNHGCTMWHCATQIEEGKLEEHDMRKSFVLLMALAVITPITISASTTSVAMAATSTAMPMTKSDLTDVAQTNVDPITGSHDATITTTATTSVTAADQPELQMTNYSASTAIYVDIESEVGTFASMKPSLITSATVHSLIPTDGYVGDRIGTSAETNGQQWELYVDAGHDPGRTADFRSKEDIARRVIGKHSARALELAA